MHDVPHNGTWRTILGLIRPADPQLLALCMRGMQYVSMKNLQIRNVPDRTHSILRRRAAAAGMSLQEYLLAVVNEATARPTVAEVLQRAAGRAGGDVTLAEAVTTLREERDAGRARPDRKTDAR